MILVDTSIWIEFLRRKEPCFTLMVQAMQSFQILTVECVFGELFQGCHDRNERDVIKRYWQVMPRVSPEGLFIEAGITSQMNRWKDQGVSLIDAVIILAARGHRAKIWTLDKKLLRMLSPIEIFSPSELTSP